MLRSTIAAAVLIPALGSVSLGAKRGNSLGDWKTADISSRECVSRWGYGDTDGASKNGIMRGGHIGKNAPPSYADMDVAGMNATKGHRRGYYGEYVFNIPSHNTFILKLEGKPVANAEVRIYQKSMDTGKMEGDPVITGTTDGIGRLPLPYRPVPLEYSTLTGCTLHPNPFGYPDVVGRNGLFLIRANVDGKWRYGFIDIGHFICEFARGNQDA